ncbi:hypothetical protein BKA69DRAFT_1059305 [Paraphysoderma sedebokerense]|nr:hypothetical protein BKA69DRAFT_1059305 [Paraphysoderma sedebokerense]
MQAFGQFQRFLSFTYQGLTDFTQAGYLKHSKNFTPNALDVDLTGRVAIVTGANSGLGRITALNYAKRGGEVHLLCRNAQTGGEAKDQIIKETGNPNVHLHIVDISRPSEVKTFAQEFTTNHRKLDVLVNNAGVLLNERKVTPDGFEATFATNTLGTYCLTSFLIPLLSKNEKSRVINVSSGGMYNSQLNVNDLQSEKSYNGDLAYSQTKRAQVEMTAKWANLHKNIFFASMHPGWADTPGVQRSLPTFRYVLKSSLRTEEQGADTIVWLAVSDEAPKHPSGQFFFDRAVAEQHLKNAKTHTREGDVEKLFEKLEALTEQATKTSENKTVA